MGLWGFSAQAADSALVWEVTGPAVVDQNGYMTIGATYACTSPVAAFSPVVQVGQQLASGHSLVNASREVNPSGGQTIVPTCDGTPHRLTLNLYAAGMQLRDVNVFSTATSSVLLPGAETATPLPAASGYGTMPVAPADPNQQLIPNTWPVPTLTIDPIARVDETASHLSVTLDCQNATSVFILYGTEDSTVPGTTPPPGTWDGYPNKHVECPSGSGPLDLPWFVQEDGSAVTMKIPSGRSALNLRFRSAENHDHVYPSRHLPWWWIIANIHCDRFAHRNGFAHRNSVAQ